MSKSPPISPLAPASFPDLPPVAGIQLAAHAAADANWGRLVMAVGKAGEAAERDRLRLWIGDEQCAESGRLCEGYSEERATEHLEGDEVRLRADIGVGNGRNTIWTCDLTHAYIDINAGYRS